MKSRKPLISIVVVNYNGAAFIEDCVNSVQNANYPLDRMQIIVVDNGSSDHSLEILNQYKPGIRVIENAVNNCCLANNIGIRESTGEFIVFLDNDVRVDKDWLHGLLKVMKTRTDAGAVGSKILFEDGRLQSTGHTRFLDYTWADRGLFEKDQGQYDAVEEVESVSNCSVMYRAKALEEVGLFDEDFMMYLEEVDMAIRMRHKNWKTYYAPQSKVTHKLHGSKQSKQKINYYTLRNRMYVLIKHFPEAIGSAIYPIEEIVRRDVSALDKYLVPIVDKTVKSCSQPVAVALLDTLYHSLKKNEDFIKFHLRAFYHDKKDKSEIEIYKPFNNIFEELKKLQLGDGSSHKLRKPYSGKKGKRSFDIAVLTDNLSFYGGKEVYALECIREWKKDNHVTIYTPLVNRKLLSDFGLDDVPVKVLSSANPLDSLYMINMLFVMPKVWEDELGIHDIYVIHSANGTILSSLSLKPCVSICHEPLRGIYDLRTWGNFSFNQQANCPGLRLYGLSDYIPMNQSRLLTHLGALHDSSASVLKEDFRAYATNSDFTAEYFESISGIKKTKTIYPGLEPVSGQFPIPKTKIKNVLFVGSLEWHKQPDMAIRTMQYIPNARLIMIGQGSLKKDLEQLIKKLRLRSKVKIYSDITIDKKRKLFQSAYCFLFIPTREPFGIVAGEAMSYAKPLIVSSDSAGYKEVLPAGAYLSVAPEPSLIAEKVKFLFENPEIAEKMGAIAQATSKEFSWKRTAQELLDLFHKTHNQYLDYSVLPKKAGTGQRKPFVGAHYFAWYNAKTREHWGDNPRYGHVGDKPQGGFYTSTSKRIIKNQLEEMDAAGIDFITVNWTISSDGVSKSELKATKTMLELIKQHRYKVKICILFSIYTDHPRALDDALNIYEAVSSNKAYFKLGDKKPLFIFITPYFFYAPFLKLNKFKENKKDVWFFAGSLFPIKNNIPEHMVNLFNGNYIACPTAFNGAETDFYELEKEYRIACGRKKNVRIFTVSPGHDDRHLEDPDREKHLFRYVCRQSGKVYKRMWEKALSVKPAPEMILIDSFNEYHETSHIESSEKYGDMYMKMTGEYIKKVKNGS